MHLKMPSIIPSDEVYRARGMKGICTVSVGPPGVGIWVPPIYPPHLTHPLPTHGHIPTHCTQYIVHALSQRNVAWNTWYHAEYFMKYFVFLYISCFIGEILITFWTVYNRWPNSFYYLQFSIFKIKEYFYLLLKNHFEQCTNCMYITDYVSQLSHQGGHNSVLYTEMSW